MLSPALSQDQRRAEQGNMAETAERLPDCQYSQEDWENRGEQAASGS